MSTSRTLRKYLGKVLSSSISGEVRFSVTAGPDEAPTVGHVGELTYHVMGVIEDPNDPNVHVEYDGAASHRPFQGIHFMTAPVGSECRLVVDTLAAPAERIRLDCLHEVALFDPCDTVVQQPNPPIITITPNPGRPPTPDDPIPGGGAG